jgi:N-acetylglucosamine-6-phosphate deacetylase
VAPGTVVIRDGQIVAVTDDDDTCSANRDEHVRLSHGLLIPGLVDLQVNGFSGVDVWTADAGELAGMAVALARAGTTSFLPTLITASVPALVDRLRSLAGVLAVDLAAARGAAPRARALGIHLEGPFLSSRRAGAHDPAWFVDPRPEFVDALVDAAQGRLAVVTLAPERVGALAAIGRLTTAGVVVAVGHSDATAVQAQAAFDAGARMVTHLFNAQRGLHHREPGVVGAALADRRVVSGLIADGHHVVASVVALAFRGTSGRIALVSDAVAAAGVPDGRSELGGVPITRTPDGAVVRDDKTLAGSASSLLDGVAGAVGAGVELEIALAAATSIPADVIGRRDVGRLEPGGRADLVWLADDLAPQATWIDGRMAAGTAGVGMSA